MPKGDRDKLKADPEDGTTPIANLLLEAIAIAKLTGKQKGVLLFLCRKTYGWVKNKNTGERFKESSFSLDDCAKALQTDRRAAQRLLGRLTDHNILIREFSKPGYGYTYRINTSVGEWNNRCLEHQLLAELTTVGLVKNTTVGLVKTPPPLGTNHAHVNKVKEILNKGNSNKDKKAKAIWLKALQELESQVKKSNYQTWLANTVGLGYHDSQFIVGVPSGHVGAYLGQNLHSLIEKVLTGLTHHHVQVQFQVVGNELEGGNDGTQ